MKDEAVLTEKFTKWNVYQRKGKKLIESVKESTPMTPSQALKHFNASAISAIIS